MTNGFKAYIERYIAARWQAVRITKDSQEQLAQIASQSGPVMIALNHPGWWDPLMCIALSMRFPERPNAGLMEGRQLAKFPFFRWVGVIPAPDNIFTLCREVGRRIAEDPRLTLWLTPQARFVDVREPIALNSGAEALRRRFPELKTWSLAIEYGFWNDPRPEAFLRLQPVARDLGQTMAENAQSLAARVRGREETNFHPLITRPTRWFESWLRL